MTIPSAFRRIACLAAVALVALVVVACLPPATRGPGSPGSSGVDIGDPASPTPITPSGPTARPSFVRPTPTPAPTFAVHVVVAGDNLTSIARRFGTTARSIAFWNRSTYPSLDPESSSYRPNNLKIGWTLFVIPNVVLSDDEAPPLPS